MQIREVEFPISRTAEFERIQWKAWDIAHKLNPMSTRYGFNVNSTHPSVIYPSHDLQPDDEWNSGELTWGNFTSCFPEYITFLDKYNFYHGITMVARPLYCAHKHGNGEHTITYPLRGCNDVSVLMVTPVDQDHVIENGIDWLRNNEKTTLDMEYKCKTGRPFIVPANHFHKTTGHPGFVDGYTIFTVWHELSTFSDSDVDRLIYKLESS